MKLIDADTFLESETHRCGCVPLVGSCSNDNVSLKERLDQQPTVDTSKTSDCKNCIDFVCQNITEYSICLHKHELYNPYNLFSCKDCEVKDCYNCIKLPVCENRKDK